MLIMLLWMVVAAAVFVVSLVVHLSTFFAIPPASGFHSLMWIHLAIFPPFFAAIIYGRRLVGSDANAAQRLFKHAPAVLRLLTQVFGIYAVVNFGLFAFRVRSGSPEIVNRKYVLYNHGRVIRELSRQEYEQQQAYILRGFSGHWMLFSIAALTLMAATRREMLDGVPARVGRAF